MGKEKIILAIDDDKMQLALFTRMLDSKYIVRIVDSASAAMRYLNTDKADVVLLDITMPNITGFEFLDDIRTIPSYMNVPVIIISGNSGHDFISQGKKAGAFEVLAKPVNPEALIRAIEKALA